MRAFDVFINQTRAGTLAEDSHGRILFRLAADYVRLPRRPVLSQSFEDDLQKSYGSKPGRLPAFFANLVPEGALRELLFRSLSIDKEDEMGLLAAAGSDLPGGVILKEAVSAQIVEENEVPFEELHEGEETGSQVGLRFSLAGIQLKFSMIRDEGRLSLPARQGEEGHWIVKFPSRRFPRLPENEYAILSWAIACGFRVPDIFLALSESLPPRLRDHVPEGEKLLVVRRYDRRLSLRVHQEDFAQAVGLHPEQKYGFTYERCAALVRAVAGDDQLIEFVRRLAFMVACGNSDAHLKNWSFLYEDPAMPILSPLYDQVATVAWKEMRPPSTGLKLDGQRSMNMLSAASFGRLAERIGVAPNPIQDAVNETLQRARTSALGGALANLPESHGRALRDHWKNVPLLRSIGSLS